MRHRRISVENHVWSRAKNTFQSSQTAANSRENSALGEKVFVRDYTNPNKPSWTDATIDKCFGPRNYGCILTKNDRLIKRHLDQIRSVGTDHKEEMVEPELT